MKKKLFLIIIILLITVIDITVNAAVVCEKEEKKRLKALAEKVEFVYDYELKEIKSESGRVSIEPIFKITASNLNPDIRVTIMEDYYMDLFQEFKDGKNTTASLDGFGAGERVPITIYGFVPNACSGVEVYKKYVKLPYYNKFSEDSRCEKYPDFKYCADLINGPIRESVFETEFNRYIDNYKKEEEVVEEKKEVSLIIILGVVGGVLVIATVAGVIVYKRKQKYSL